MLVSKQISGLCLLFSSKRVCCYCGARHKDDMDLYGTDFLCANTLRTIDKHIYLAKMLFLHVTYSTLHRVTKMGSRHFFVPRSGMIEHYRHSHSDCPAERPGKPYTCCPEEYGQYLSKYNTKYQVGECRSHKLLHHSCTPQYTVGNEFCGYNKVKRRQYLQEPYADLHCCSCRFVKEDIHKIFSCEQIGSRERYAQHPYELYARLEAFLYSRQLICSYVLGSKVRYAIP